MFCSEDTRSKRIYRQSCTLPFLDLVHETVHMFQLDSGMNLFDKRYRYIDRPTELEAYETAVAEGKKLNMTDGELFDYLAVDWVSDSDHPALAEKLGVGRA
jgi:hypothetical protein